MTLAELVRERLDSLPHGDLSKLAKKTGISVSYLSDLANGKSQNPSLNVLEKIIEATGGRLIVEEG